MISVMWNLKKQIKTINKRANNKTVTENGWVVIRGEGSGDWGEKGEGGAII